MGFIDSIVWAFEKFREKPLESIINSILLSLVGGLTAIPLVGGFIEAYVEPIILKRIAESYGLPATDDLSVARKAFMIIKGIPALIFWILFLYAGFSLMHLSLHSIFKFFFGVIVTAIIGIVLAILFTYSAYAGVLGKINKLEIEPGKSFSILILQLVITLVFGFIASLLGYIPTIGPFLTILIGTLVIPVIVAAASLRYAYEL